MSILAKFFTYEGYQEKVKKDISWGESDRGATQIKSYEDIDDFTCDFILNGSGYHGNNYMAVKWPGITKYYFIQSRTGMPGNMTKIRAKCDVLFTYKNSVYGTKAVINRTNSEKEYFTNPMLKDNKITTLSETEFDSTSLLNLDEIIADQEYIYVGILQKIRSISN